MYKRLINLRGMETFLILVGKIVLIIPNKIHNKIFKDRIHFHNNIIKTRIHIKIQANHNNQTNHNNKQPRKIMILWQKFRV